MSTMIAGPVQTTTAHTCPTLPPARAADRVGFGSLITIELRKLVNTRAAFWLLASVAALTLACTVGVTVLFGQLADGLKTDVWSLARDPIAVFANLLVPAMGVLLVTQEWSTRTTLSSYTLEPRRGRSIAAKAVVVALLGVVTYVITLALAAVAASLAQANGDSVSWTMNWVGLGGSFITFMLIMAMAFGFALATMNLSLIHI